MSKRITGIVALIGVFATVSAVYAEAAPPTAALPDLARLQPGRTMRSSTSDADWRNGNQDALQIEPGQTLTVTDIAGPGLIQHIWNTVAPGDLGYGRLLVLRFYWDGEETPSVVCPLGDFFGVGHGLDRPFQSALVCASSHGRARNCYWPMPFRKSARITVTNEGIQTVLAFFWQVDWQKLPELPSDTPYFHAHYRQEHPTKMGQNYVIADIRGRGHYVGTLLNVRQHTSNWWGEGDDFIFIDGEAEPSIRGTGTEDYFNDAWGLRLISYPYYGVTVDEQLVPLARTSAYRWHVPDPIVFQKSLRFEIEHKGVVFNEDGSVKSAFGERRDDFSSVAYWYQIEPHAPMAPLPPAKERVYHDPHAVIEAEKLLEADRIVISDGRMDLQWGPWSNARQVQWHEPKPGSKLTMPLEVSQAGEHTLNVNLTLTSNGGIYQVAIDGNPIGKPIDLYTRTFHNRDFQLAGLNLSAGEHKLTFECVGANPASTDTVFNIDCLLLTRNE